MGETSVDEAPSRQQVAAPTGDRRATHLNDAIRANKPDPPEHFSELRVIPPCKTVANTALCPHGFAQTTLNWRLLMLNIDAEVELMRR